MFLSFIKLFSLYSLTLFNRRRNLIFRLSMLHFRFEEDRDVSIRIIFRFVVERTKRIRKVSEPWIRFCKLIVARKSFSFLFPSFFFFFFFQMIYHEPPERIITIYTKQNGIQLIVEIRSKKRWKKGESISCHRYFELL